MGLVFPVWAVDGSSLSVWTINGFFGMVCWWASFHYLGYRWAWKHIFGPTVGLDSSVWAVSGFSDILLGCQWAFYFYGPLVGLLLVWAVGGPLVGLVPPFGPGFIRLGL